MQTSTLTASPTAPALPALCPPKAGSLLLARCRHTLPPARWGRTLCIWALVLPQVTRILTITTSDLPQARAMASGLASRRMRVRHSARHSSGSLSVPALPLGRRQAWSKGCRSRATPGWRLPTSLSSTPSSRFLRMSSLTSTSRLAPTSKWTRKLCWSLAWSPPPRSWSNARRKALPPCGTRATLPSPWSVCAAALPTLTPSVSRREGPSSLRRASSRLRVATRPSSPPPSRAITRCTPPWRRARAWMPPSMTIKSSLSSNTRVWTRLSTLLS